MAKPLQPPAAFGSASSPAELVAYCRQQAQHARKQLALLEKSPAYRQGDVTARRIAKRMQLRAEVFEALVERVPKEAVPSK